jgi:hypothetical protein
MNADLKGSVAVDMLPQFPSSFKFAGTEPRKIREIQDESAKRGSGFPLSPCTTVPNHFMIPPMAGKFIYSGKYQYGKKR